MTQKMLRTVKNVNNSNFPNILCAMDFLGHVIRL